MYRLIAAAGELFAVEERTRVPVSDWQPPPSLPSLRGLSRIGLDVETRDPEIRETLAKVKDPVEACRILIEDANQSGGTENSTVLALELTREPA